VTSVVQPGSRRPAEAASRKHPEVFREAGGAGGLQGAGELRARADPELPKDAAEVSLDRVLGDEERLRDLAVRHSFSGQTCDAQLGGGEVAAALAGISARTRTGSDQLLVGLCD